MYIFNNRNNLHLDRYLEKIIKKIKDKIIKYINYFFFIYSHIARIFSNAMKNYFFKYHF